MSDIVERLRELPSRIRLGAADIIEEQAAEIERLRREKAAAQGLAQGAGLLADQQRERAEAAEAEIERLREERKITSAEIELRRQQMAADAISYAKVTQQVNELRTVNDGNMQVSEMFRHQRDAAEARLAEAVEVLLDVNDAAQIGVLMEGPRLQGWRRSELDRLWPKLRAFLAKQEGLSDANREEGRS